MLHYDLSDYERCFRDNLYDWRMGGPKPGGWTREGGELASFDFARLGWLERRMVSLEEAMWKNEKEVQKWHVDFLTSNNSLEETLYYREYLITRMRKKDAVQRSSRFLELFKTMKEAGYDSKFPVVLIKSECLGGLFRIDGCHRLACAKVLGMNEVPAIIFKAVALQCSC